jgi:hypothetical protein
LDLVLAENITTYENDQRKKLKKKKKKNSDKSLLRSQIFTSLPKDNTPDSQLVTKRKQLQHYVLLYSTTKLQKNKMYKINPSKVRNAKAGIKVAHWQTDVYFVKKTKTSDK